MQLEHALVRLEDAVATQIRLGDEAVADIAEQLMDALRPAIRQTLLDLAENAATEVSSQLKGQRVEIRMRDGDPLLVVTDLSPASAQVSEETLEARITLRLSESLKSVIEEAAEDSGDSINSWVLNALRSKTMARETGSSVKTTIDL